MEKIFVIGDIHGCFDKLRVLIDKIKFDPKHDSLVFLGDYIDRGPDSFEVVTYLINLKKQFRNIIFLKGNHEDMLENYLSGLDRSTFLYNGGNQTLQSYCKHVYNNLIPPEHLKFFESLVLFYQTDNYIFVHAGLRDNIRLERQNPKDLLWIRSSFIESNCNFGKRVIFGHTPFEKPFVQSNKIGIDTGAVYGNLLTCVELPELVFYHA